MNMLSDDGQTADHVEGQNRSEVNVGSTPAHTSESSHSLDKQRDEHARTHVAVERMSGEASMLNNAKQALQSMSAPAKVGVAIVAALPIAAVVLLFLLPSPYAGTT